MGARGPKPKERCKNEHDLTLPGAVRVVPRKRKGKVYQERQCTECVRKRSREWWRDNRGTASNP